MLKKITSMNILMQKSKAVGNAKQHGTKEDIKNAQDELDAYKQHILESDEMSMNMCKGDLCPKQKEIDWGKPEGNEIW